MFDDRTRALIDGPHMGHVATLMPDGSPHVVPVWLARDGERVQFVKVEGSVGLRNLERDSRLSISILDRDNQFLMAHLRGQAVGFERDKPVVLDWLDSAARQYAGRDYATPDDDVVLVTVQPARMWSRLIETYG